MLNFDPQIVTSGYQSVDLLNENFEAIQEALADGLSRSSSTPNDMDTNLDMQSHRIYNLPNAIANGEPVTYQQWLAQFTVEDFTGVLKELQTATEGQTVFTLAVISYTPGLGALSVYADGIRIPSNGYTETNSTTVTFANGFPVDTEIEFVVYSFSEAV